MKNALDEARLALKILGDTFTSSDISDEKVFIISEIIKNQSLKMNIGWKTLLGQYKELSFEIYKKKFTNNEFDFFEQVQKYIESGRKLI